MFRIVLALLILALPAQAEPPHVVADIAPVQSLVAQVMQGVGEPALIIQHGASPHAYALRPSDAAALEQADLVFWVGHALTPSLEAAIETLATDAQVVELLDHPDTHTMPFRDAITFDAHDDHTDDADDDTDGDHDDHDHGGVDPHAWLDPSNGAAWLNLIAAELGRIDPDNAAIFAENARAGQAEIAAAVTQANEILAPVRTRPFVVFHDAYQYYERAFGLAAAGAITLSDASDPSPARIAAIRDRIQALGVTCVFSEPQFNTGLVNAVADGAEIETAVLDPMGSHLPTGAGFYPALFTDLARAMANCP